jgi:hypothetical protein
VPPDDRLPGIDQLAAIVEVRAAGPDAAARLRAAVELGGELADLSDATIGRFVAEARSAGMSWTEIGAVFGTSKQAVQQRFGTSAAEPGRWPGPWTADARAALDRAVRESAELGHDFVGTEHVLLALATAERGVAAEVLVGLGVTGERILSTPCLKPGPEGSPAARPLMPRLKQALEHSVSVAGSLGAAEAGTEHLLAGIVAVPDAMAVEILRRLGAPAADVSAALAARLEIEPERLQTRRRRRRSRLFSPSR